MINQERRNFMTLTAATVGAAVVASAAPSFAASALKTERSPMTKLVLPNLPYAIDALAPIMSAETLEYHHGKHHKAYVDKGNEFIEKFGLQNKSVEDIITSSFGKDDQAGLFNNVAQYWNHVHFWQWMKPNGGGEKLPGNLEAPFQKAFGDFKTFRDKFIEAGMGQFGSGWAWIASDDQGNLSILKTANGDNPLTKGKHAILGVDVWEHSYYIDYRNARQKYLESFVDKLINWDHVAHMYGEATGKKAAA